MKKTLLLVTSLAFCFNLFAQVDFNFETIIDHSYFINDISSISHADLDGDGNEDILASSDYQISWIRNNDGLGNFDKPIKITDDVIDYPVISLDVDNDGDLDIVTVSNDNFKLIYYENSNGLGNFSTSQVISSENVNFGPLVASDIDNDGDLDIVNGGNDLIWYENINGATNFVQHVIPYEYGSFITVVQPKDIDNDGDADLIVLENSDSVFYQLNLDGQGNFGPKQYIITDLNNVTSINLADIDGDSDFDVVALSDFGYYLSWYENIDGSDNFGSQQSIMNFTYDFGTFDITDLDGDNDTDIIMSTTNTNEIIWLENNNSMGNFVTQQFNISNKYGTSVTLPINIDLDGDIDLISFSFLENRISLYKNESNTGNFIEQILTPSVMPLLDIATADIDGNGSVDILSAQNNKVAWYKNINGLFAYRSQQVISTELDNAWYIDPSDIDGDSSIDVVVTTSGSENKVVWYKNIDGSGNFSSENIVADNLGNPYWAKSADIDGDMDMDIVILDNGSNAILWCENLNGLGDFGSPIAVTVGFNVAPNGECHLKDFDNDGDIDILTASTQDDTLVWFQNTDGQGNFSSQIIIDDANFMQAVIAVGDIDMDGDLDIVSKNALRIRWYANDGLGNFGTSFEVNNNNRLVDAIEILDVDDDGDNDIMVGSNNSSNGLSFFMNNDGSGTFSSEELIYEGQFTTGELVSDDVNNDGVTDLIVAGGNFEFNGPGTGYINWFDSQNSLSINEFDNDTIALFPNPTHSIINLESKLTIDAISIYDIKGRLIISKKLNSKNSLYQIDARILTSGIYLLEIQSGKSKSTKKFIKI